MKKTIVFALLATLGLQAANLAAQNSPEAIYKLLRYEWTLRADGTSDYHYRHEVQILRNRALTAYADKGETFVVYNPDLEELTVNEVYTIQKDGTRVNMPQNAFIYQLPSECADCGRFNHMRELAMVHTGMELGCTIVVDYTIHRQYNFMHESIPIQRECPVEKLEVVVNYNNNEMELGYTIDGSQYLDFNNVERVSSINTETSDRVLRYTFTDVKQAPREPYMPADIIPTLRIFNGTPEFTPAFDQQPFTGAGDYIGAVMYKKGKTDFAAVRDFVNDYIHLNNIHPSHLGYRHATAEEVWQSGCGTATEHAVLLAAILNSEGYSAMVTGDNSDEVAVIVDTLEYRIPATGHGPMTLYGEAKDEVKTISQNGTFDATLDTLEDGFFSFPMPVITINGERDLWIRASQLPLVRTTPLQASACDIRSDVTFLLPKGLKMVGGNISRKLAFDGVGSVEYTVKQSGTKLRIVRNLKIEKSLIPVDDYAKYRQLMATWQGLESVLFRSK